MVSDKVVIAGIVATGLAAGGLFGVLLTHNSRGGASPQLNDAPAGSTTTATDVATPPHTITLLPPSSTATFELDTTTATPTVVEPERGNDTTAAPTAVPTTRGRPERPGEQGKTRGKGRQQTPPREPTDEVSVPVVTHTLNTVPGTTTTLGRPATGTTEDWATQWQQWWSQETESWWETPTLPEQAAVTDVPAAHVAAPEKDWGELWAQWFTGVDVLPGADAED